MEANSYRPVSNLSLIGKILGRAVMEQIERPIQKNELMNKDHHGGRAGHSTTKCIEEILEEV